MFGPWVVLYPFPTDEHAQKLNIAITARKFDNLTVHVDSAVAIYLDVMATWDKGLEVYLWHPKKPDHTIHPNTPSKAIMKRNGRNLMFQFRFTVAITHQLHIAGASSLGLHTCGTNLASAWEFYLWICGFLAGSYQLRADTWDHNTQRVITTHRTILAF